jgi:hypothetical protein
MGQKFPAQLESQQVIAGLFKEALFLGRTIIIESGEIVSELAIVGISESSNRGDHADRAVLIKPISVWREGTRLEPEGQSATLSKLPPKLNFKCYFPDFIAWWDSELEFSAIDTFKFKLPESISVSNKRTISRVPLDGLPTDRTPILVQMNGLHCEGLFEVENTSLQGIGGVITVPEEYLFGPGATLVGSAKLGKGSISIDGSIVHATLVPPASHGGRSFRIGLRRTEERASVVNADRRQFKRVTSEDTISVRSPFNESYLIKLRLLDASVSGFSCTLSNPSDIALVPLGCVLRTETYDLFVEAIHFQQDILRFRIVSGESKGRVSWLSLLSSLQNANTTGASPVGRDLVDLFCESGALAPGFLSAQSVFSKRVLTGLSEQPAEDPWTHRWIEHTENGEIRGHISAIRFGNSAWLMADLAGSYSTEKRVTRDFVPKFFTSFSEFALTCTPCPRILLSWATGHPYWGEYQEYLDSKQGSELLCSIETVYTRFSNRILGHTGSADFVIEQVHPTDFQLIRSIESTVSGTGLHELLRTFDFSIESFASFDLRKSIAKSGHSFSRKYFHLRSGDRRYLIIGSHYPDGTSPNRTPDVLWMIPLIGGSIPAEFREAVFSALRALFLAQGVDIPGALEVTLDRQTKKQFANASGTKSMIWNLVHPSALRWFRK